MAKCVSQRWHVIKPLEKYSYQKWIHFISQLQNSLFANQRDPRRPSTLLKNIRAGWLLEFYYGFLVSFDIFLTTIMNTNSTQKISHISYGVNDMQIWSFCRWSNLYFPPYNLVSFCKIVLEYGFCFPDENFSHVEMRWINCKKREIDSDRGAHSPVFDAAYQENCNVLILKNWF